MAAVALQTLVQLTFPDFCLLLVVMPRAAARHGRILRRLHNQTPAGAVTHELEQAAARLESRAPVVVPLCREDDRLPWHQLGKRYHARRYGLLVTDGQRKPPSLDDEGFAAIHMLATEAAQRLELHWEPLPCDKRQLCAPFDIIGDLHGCCEELEELLHLLGYETCPPPRHELWPRVCWRHPQGRKALFLGDLADRGPCILEGFSMVAGMVAAGHALCVPGNHDIKFRNYLQGRNMPIKHGLEDSVRAMAGLGHEQRTHTAQAIVRFVDSMPRHLVLHQGALVAAHAGLEERLHLRDDDTARRLAIWGPATGEQDEFGLPVRINWGAHYQGQALVVYGHTPVLEPAWQGRTVNIDTGCVFGGGLTALRYPELETVSVPARRVYCAPPRPIRSVAEFTG